MNKICINCGGEFKRRVIKNKSEDLLCKSCIDNYPGDPEEVEEMVDCFNDVRKLFGEPNQE